MTSNGSTPLAEPFGATKIIASSTAAPPAGNRKRPRYSSPSGGAGTPGGMTNCRSTTPSATSWTRPPRPLRPSALDAGLWRALADSPLATPAPLPHPSATAKRTAPARTARLPSCCDVMELPPVTDERSDLQPTYYGHHDGVVWSVTERSAWSSIARPLRDLGVLRLIRSERFHHVHMRRPCGRHERGEHADTDQHGRGAENGQHSGRLHVLDKCPRQTGKPVDRRGAREDPDRDDQPTF